MKRLRTDALETLRSKLRRLIADDAENIDKALAYDLEAQIILNVRAGFLSIDEIAEEVMEYISEEYLEVKKHISAGALQELVKGYWDEYANTGKQENYLKLASAFRKLNEQGIVALHCAGYVQSDGFDDCNEIAADMDEDGETVIGCCFYTLQDLEHVLKEDTTKLRISFGNYFDKPTAVEIGKMIVKELEAAGFVTEWKQSVDEKIAVRDMVWDKVFETKENALFQQSAETGRGDFIVEHGVLKKYAGSDEKVVIPDGIAEIGPWAFKDCVFLIHITIPENVEMICSAAFAGCRKLTGITIPDSVKSLDGTIFNGCTALTSLILPAKVRKIDESAFQMCTSLANIIIPDGVRKIHKLTFCGCINLKNVTISDGVRKIDKTAFEDCDLTKLTICATVGSYAEEFAMENKFSFSAI